MAPALVILAAGLGRRFGGAKQLAPVGPRGETILDHSVHRGMRAGFSRVVLVVNAGTSAAIEARTARWPSSLRVDLVEQDPGAGPSAPAANGARADGIAGRAEGAAGRPSAERWRPLGTAHAVLAARALVEDSFAVLNADDLYGQEALSLLFAHLSCGSPKEHALVGYRLDRTLDSHGPVSRAVCTTNNGLLQSITEMTVERRRDGSFDATARVHATSPDSVAVASRTTIPAPLRLDGTELVSMNAWGFREPVFSCIERAVVRFLERGQASAGEELLLPDVVNQLVQDGSGAAVRVLETGERCMGVTHKEDLARLRREIRDMTRAGELPDPLWGAG